jgi:tRNA A37 threonylcarbamoyladenosine dehydratase
MDPAAPIGVELGADLERRFGGLRRLYGDAGYERVRSLHVVVVGLGGVGSWTCEALARSGVAALTLIDLDHVSESNVNRQIQALESTIGQSKAQALQERIAQIHPGCRVVCIEEFVDADNWPALVDGGLPIDAVVDACDQVRAKRALAAWAIATATPLVAVGAAGGKRKPQAVEADDLARVTHDPLLASLRQQLRKFHGGARTGEMGVRCVFSREPVMQPESAVCLPGEATDNDGSLNCHGYGSTVTVTATFGMVAASEALTAAMTHSPASRKAALPVPEKISTPDGWTTAFTVI